MKKCCCLFLIVIFFVTVTIAQKSSGTEVLNNDAIVMLSKAGMSKELIIEKIKSSATNFDLSTKELVRLKNEKVDDLVVAEMLKGSAKREDAGTGKKLSSGIYYIKDSANLVQLDPTPLTGGKSAGMGNTLGHVFAGGIVRKKDILIIDRPESNFKISNASPNFYFVFNLGNQGLNNDNVDNRSFIEKYIDRSMGQSGSASSPNDFILIKTDIAKNSREIKTEGRTIHDAGGGISKKQIVSFKFEKLEEGKYRVYFEKPLEEGEYCFHYANALVDQDNVKIAAPKVYDFGISLNKKY